MSERKVHCDGCNPIFDKCPGLPDYAALISRLAAALEDLLSFGVELDDERMNYIIAQVSRGDVAEARAALAMVPEELRIGAKKK